MSNTLILERDGAVATVTLNRPESKNALDAELVEALGQNLTELSSDKGVRVIVLGGAGGAFCSGADLKAIMADPSALETAGEALRAYHRVILAIVSAPKPVVARVDGAAVGFGCDLALACDLRVMSDRAYLQEKFVRIGLMPDGGGTLWLTRMIGVGRALEALLLGDAIDAARSAELGLANRVVPAKDLDAHTAELAARLAKGAPLAHAAIKRAVRAALAGGIEEALAAEREGQLRCLRSQDFIEGVTAWMQKRDPRFEGR